MTIPAGKFLMGSDKTKDNLADNDEQPQHEVYLPTFQIARYPVMVAQFEQFVKATNYITIAEHRGSAWNWQKLKDEWKLLEIKGAYWAQPHCPGSDVKAKATHPVTCVSWEDANTFCRWATEVLRTAGQTIYIRLPSEAEWEKAARSSLTRSETVRIYPWGNELPDKEHCNFNMNEGDTTPVNRYPQGKSFYAVWDMVGNVWEWTRSLYKDYPYDPNDGREDPASGDHRVVRGGSFDYNHRFVRAAYRNHDFIIDRNDDVGFRVVAVGS